MRYKSLKTILLFLIIFSFFCILGSFIIKKFPLSSFSGEAVFAASISRPTLTSTIFSALPYQEKVKAPATEIHSQAIPLENPPATEKYPTYDAEPAVVNSILQIKNSTNYPVDVNAILAETFTFSSENPTVLIVHTHTSEAYAQSEKYTYIPSDPFRTEDSAYNICFVGQVLAKTLENHGIKVIHDTTSHDYPSYSGCYNRSLSTIERNLSADSSIEIVIDLHRDAISDADGSYMKTAAEINGKTAAQALVIIGTDAGGLAHPEWHKNLILGLKVQKTLCDMYPGFARPLHLRTERFNGHASRGALLIEIGSNANTMEEALYGAELFGNALSETITSLTD